MDLTPGQRDRIRQLLEDELREAYGRAIDGGVPRAAVEQDVAGRRRALEQSARRPATDDVEDPVHETGQGSGIGQQR